MNIRPIAVIMQADTLHLNADELRAGVEHCERMIYAFEQRLYVLQAEQARRGIKSPRKARKKAPKL
jgi:hypothetical protein